MTYCLRFTTTFALLAVLTACGGAGNPFGETVNGQFGPITEAEAAGVADAYAALREDVLAMPISTAGTVPTSGQATFTGMVEMVVVPTLSTTSMNLVGDVVLNADFGGPFMTARMDDFAGANMIGDIVRLDGQLQMNDGQIGGTSGGDIAGTFSGILLGDELEISTSGAFDGQMRGVPSNAVSFSGFDSNALVDGADATVALSGFAEE